MRELDYDPISGMRTTFDWRDDKMIIGYEQDTTAIIEANKAELMDLDQHKRQSKAGWAPYARIPDIVVLEWKVKYGVDFGNPNHFKKCMGLLNDPEYKYLKRTSYRHDR